MGWVRSPAGAREGTGRGWAGAREGTGRGWAGARGRDGAWPGWRPGKGRGVAGLAPGKREAAVSATALAGCGRGRDGRGCGEWERLHAGATDERPKCLLVTEMSGSPVFLPSSTTLRSRDGSLGGLWRPQLSERVTGPRSRPSEGRQCDVPDIFVTGPISPTSLSGGTVTEVRLRVGLPSHPQKPRTSRASPRGPNPPRPPPHPPRPHPAP